MQTLFGMDLSTGQKWIIAFAVILVLLALLGLFARQLKGGRLRLRGQGGGRARQPRLGVVDIHDLDRQRQLVLIRRDNVEHLVMIGGASDVVVESNIVRGSQRSTVAVPQDLAPYERPVPFDLALPPEPRESEERRTPPLPEPPSREPVRQEPSRQDAARQEPVRQDAVKQDTARQEPVPPPGQTQPGAVDAISAAAAAAVATGAATALGSSENKPSAPSFTREQSPAPQPSAGELDDMTRQLEAALKRPFSAVRPGQAPVQPSEPLVDITSSRPREEPKIAPPEPVVPAPAPEPRIEDLTEETIEPVTLTAPPPREPKPAPLPVDVAAELEMALGLKPEPVAPRPSRPIEPVAPAPQAVTITPPPVPSQASAPPDDIDDTLDLPAKSSEPDEDTPSIVGADTPKNANEPDKATEPKELDPFSVEAIEAEFARLLGRDPKAKS